jgi:predicted Zn-dependent protease
MKKRLPLLALSLFCAGRVWALDATAQKLADRYLAILQGNPAQQTALDRLWKIYGDAGEVEAFKELSRQQAETHPVLAAALLQKAGLDEEADTILQTAAEKGVGAAAEVLATRLAARGDAIGAAAVLEKAVAVQPSPGLWMQLGLCRHRTGDAAGARDAWEKAVVLSPEDLGLRRKLAQVCATAGDREAAVLHWQAIADHGSPSERFEAWQEISRQRAASGQWAEAIAAQESLLALMGPGHWQLESARRRLFELRRQAGTLGVLEKAWLEEAKARPHDAQPALRLAEYYDFVGRPGDRLTWLRKAAERLPSDTAVLCEAAALELAAGRHAEAAALYDRALAARPGQPDLLFLRAEVAVLAGDEAGAEKRVEEYLSAHPGDESAVGRVQEFYRRMRLSAPLELRLTARLSASPGDESAALELARFYLDENRHAAAAEVLGRLDLSSQPPEKVADLALRFSQLLSQAHVDDQALVWAKKAVDQAPAKPEYVLHLAELLAAAGEMASAREVLDRACEQAGGLPREDIDRRLHLLVRGRSGGKTVGEPNYGEMSARMETLRGRAWRRDSTEADWLRLARWLRWNGDPAGAVTALREAVRRSPESERLRDVLATVLVETGDTAGAIKELQILVERFPENSLEYRKRAGHLEFDRGNADDGLRTFASLAAQRPGEWQAIVDLALAEQAAGNWFRALETWQRAYGLASQEARPGIRQPLLNAAARLQLHDRALDFLEEAAAAEKNLAAREDLLREAAAYAVQNQAVPSWRDRIDRHLADAPEKRTWEMANVFLLEAEGRKDEARAALIETQRDLEDSAEVLSPLIKAAEKAEDWDEAARLTRRLLALARHPDATQSMQLARYLELGGRWDDAAAAWTAVASLHGRDPAALTAAAGFFDRTGNEEKMETCYRGAARFGNCAPQVLLRLGRLALERGDRFQALEDFSQVLERVRPDPSAREILPLPDLLAAEPAAPSPGLAAPSGWRRPAGQPVPWTHPSETENEGCRLLAIREAGRLLANSPNKPAWLGQFTLPVERIWALYASGEIDAAFDLVAKISVEPAAREVNAQMYAALLIDAGDGDRLARWASQDPARSDAHWDAAVAALVRLMEAGWRPTELEVFARAPAIKRWQFARVLASRNLYVPACELAKTVPPELPEVVGPDVFPASAAWLEFARWQLALRDPDGAVASLDRALEGMPPSVTLGGPFLAAARARWLLTPKDLRLDFEKAMGEKLEKTGLPGGADAAAALFAALRGDHAAGDAALAKLFTAIEASGEGVWSTFIQQSGAQLEDWGLARLARELYRQELARDRALTALQGQDFRLQTENLLVANQILSARPESVSYLLNEWMARGAGNDELLRLADTLRQRTLSDRAAQVLVVLADREPRDDAVLGGMLAFVDDPVTRPLAAVHIEKRLADPRSGPSLTLVQNAAKRLAAQWEQAGEYHRCLNLLDRLREAGLAHRAIAQQRIRVLCLLGRHREALEEVETQVRPLPPAGPGLSLSLASLYTGFGRIEEARAVLEKEAAGSSPDRAAAREKMLELFPGESRPAPDPAARLAALDREGVSKPERFRQGKEFLAAYPDLPEAVRSAEMERLRRLATRDPKLLSEFFALQKELADKHGRTAQFRQELEKEWDQGRGRREAGETLLLVNLEAKNFAAVSALLDQILVDAHFNEAAWDHYGQVLLLAGQSEPAARMLSALVARAPGNPNRALFLAEALWKSGRQTEARELVYPIERIAALDTPRRVDLARYELAVGNLEAARRHLLTMPGQPTEAAAILWSRLASEFLAAGKIDEARAALERALAVPSSVSGAQLADFHAAVGDLAEREPGSAEFRLPSRLRRDFQIETASRLASADNFLRAWLWLEACERPLAVPAGRDLLRKLESSDPARAMRLWEAALDADATWEMRCAAAACFLRRAQTESAPEARLALLQRAHELHPGSFAIADQLAQAFLGEGKDERARQTYRKVLVSFSEASDRAAATKCLSELPASLPPAAPLR